jgi:hypothetical protein
MKQTLNDIILKELTSEVDSILDYRMAIASGISDFVDPALNDDEIIQALEKVILHYKTKVEYVSPMTDEARDIDLDMGIAFDSDSAVHPYAAAYATLYNEYDSKRITIDGETLPYKAYYAYGNTELQSANTEWLASLAYTNTEWESANTEWHKDLW